MASRINIKNKKAFYQYFILDRYTTGIMLTGTEIKSIRDGKANLSDAFCVLKDGEVFIMSLHISEYQYGSCNNHDPKRTRKLLLTKKEIKKLEAKVIEKGLTIIPLYLFVNERGLAKMEIAVAKGKKLYDKRETLKAKDTKREMDRRF